MAQASWDWPRPLAMGFTLAHKNKKSSSSSFFFLLEKTYKQNPSHFLKTQGHAHGHRRVCAISGCHMGVGRAKCHHHSVELGQFSKFFCSSLGTPLSLVWPHRFLYLAYSPSPCGFKTSHMPKSPGLRFCSATLTARRLLYLDSWVQVVIKVTCDFSCLPGMTEC